MKTFLALAILLLAGCNSPAKGEDLSPPDLEQVRSICEVVASPSAYLGSHILLRGVYFSDPHHRFIKDKNCSRSEIAVQLSEYDPREDRIIEAVRATKGIAEFSVVYGGILSGDEMIAGCAKPDCVMYTLKDARLLSVSNSD